MQKYPYRDSDLKCWIYDKIPEKMIQATQPDQIKVGATILVKAVISSLAGLYIAIKVCYKDIDTIRKIIPDGRVFVKKVGFNSGV